MTEPVREEAKKVDHSEKVVVPGRSRIADLINKFESGIVNNTIVQENNLKEVPKDTKPVETIKETPEPEIDKELLIEEKQEEEQNASVVEETKIEIEESTTVTIVESEETPIVIIEEPESEETLEISIEEPESEETLIFETLENETAALTEQLDAVNEPVVVEEPTVSELDKNLNENVTQISNEHNEPEYCIETTMSCVVVEVDTIEMDSHIEHFNGVPEKKQMVYQAKEEKVVITRRRGCKFVEHLTKDDEVKINYTYKKEESQDKHMRESIAQTNQEQKETIAAQSSTYTEEKGKAKPKKESEAMRLLKAKIAATFAEEKAESSQSNGEEKMSHSKPIEPEAKNEITTEVFVPDAKIDVLPENKDTKSQTENVNPGTFKVKRRGRNDRKKTMLVADLKEFADDETKEDSG